MKKNVMMRLASFLLVAVLISTSAISGTYAKYTTQDSGADEARVAKWGVELQVFGNLYGTQYGADDKIVKADDASITVQTLDTNLDVVAPCTKNAEGLEISLKGTPEVDGVITTEIKAQNIFLAAGQYGVMVPVEKEITEATFNEYKEVAAEELYTLDGTTYNVATAFEADAHYYTLEDYVKVDADYYPVVYTLTGHTSTTGTGIAADSLNAAAKLIADKLGATVQTPAEGDPKHLVTYKGTKEFETNTDLAKEYKLDDLVLTWAWAFGDEDSDGDDAEWTDKADTILGDLHEGGLTVVTGTKGGTFTKVASEKYCLNTQFSIDITVTQVD